MTIRLDPDGNPIMTDAEFAEHLKLPHMAGVRAAFAPPPTDWKQKWVQMQQDYERTLRALEELQREHEQLQEKFNAARPSCPICN